MDVSCDKIRAGFKLKCDETCDNKRKVLAIEKEEQEKRRRELEEIENRKELEKYEQKFGKKVYKDRRKNVVEEKKDGGLLQKLIPVAAALSIALVALVIYNLYWSRLNYIEIEWK